MQKALFTLVLTGAVALIGCSDKKSNGAASSACNSNATYNLITEDESNFQGSIESGKVVSSERDVKRVRITSSVVYDHGGMYVPITTGDGDWFTPEMSGISDSEITTQTFDFSKNQITENTPSEKAMTYGFAKWAYAPFSSNNQFKLDTAIVEQKFRQQVLATPGVDFTICSVKQANGYFVIEGGELKSLVRIEARIKVPASFL